MRANDAVDQLTQQNRRLVEQLDSVQPADESSDEGDNDAAAAKISP